MGTAGTPCAKEEGNQPLPSVRIYGLDFTSAPSARKPITCARCRHENGGLLAVEALALLEDFAALESLLASPGPWVAGLDFPFGQPRRLIEDLAWPPKWSRYVGQVARMHSSQFERLLREYCDARPSGRKHHLRAVDRRAGARSPMMLYGVPVGKMFFRGAPRLLRSPASVLPCRPRADDRVALEAYPALVARRLIGRRSYKSERAGKDTPARRDAREAIVQAASSSALVRAYGLTLRLPAALSETLVGEPSADGLDAVLCAIQAAWAWTRRDERYGIPRGADALEGWIVDPALGGRRPPPGW